MSGDAALIRLEGIAKHYQMGGETIAALNGIDLEIARNDYVAFIGSSGSGKSTHDEYPRLPRYPDHAASIS